MSLTSSDESESRTQRRLKRLRWRPVSMTPRKRQILYYCFLGKTNAEIGQILGISPLTIKNHLLHISILLDASTRANAVYKAIHRGILDLPGYVYVGDAKERVVGVKPEVRWLRCGRVQISDDIVKARVGRTYLELNPMDFRLLLYLVQRPHTVHSRDTIMSAVWGNNAEIFDRVVDRHINRIRRQLSKAGATDVIETVLGFGYRMRG